MSYGFKEDLMELKNETKEDFASKVFEMGYFAEILFNKVFVSDRKNKYDAMAVFDDNNNFVLLEFAE
jgi:hypothetical protein